MTESRHSALQEWDDRLGPVMFIVSIAFLAALAVLLHVGSGVDLLASLATASVDEPEQAGWEVWCVAIMGLSYVMVIAEALLWAVAGSSRWKRHLPCIFFPALRVAARDHTDGTSVWLPVRGWTAVDTALRDRLEKRFSVPMIGVALLVLPLIIFEYFWADQIAESFSLTVATSLSAALIWFAFAFEFVLMMSVVEKRVSYCKEHWIDIVVILAPMVAFLRMARISRVLRLKQITKTARVYRMRGVLMRTYRAVLLLELVQRIVWGGPERRLKKLRAVLAEKREEVAELEQAVQELEMRMAASEEPDSVPGSVPGSVPETEPGSGLGKVA